MAKRGYGSGSLYTRIDAAGGLTLVEPRVHRMLGHPLRHAIVERLEESPATTAQLAEHLGESRKYISRQMGELLRVEVVEVADARPNSRGGSFYRVNQTLLCGARPRRAVDGPDIERSA